MEKSFRIHTNIIKDTLLNVNLKQDFDFMEILSLKLRQKDAYRLHSSNYGVIIGRVLANDAFGIPNAKISVFIERDENDPVDMENVYPYSEVTSKDKEGRRYNLLPDYSDDDCYRVVGTFPQKRYLLDDNIQLAVYDKYYKYTTVTNNAGDYMIFGVPTGSQTVHVDIDLSDIGILSQKPRDFTYRGYDLSEFDSPSQFKASTNYDSLRQIFSQDKSVYVYPFWGDAENGVAAITRCDVQIAYKFEPTCVFMGSIVSDNEGNSIGHKCAPNEENGMNAQLIAGEGTIEMIRKTTDGLVEEYPIQGNALIDSDGVWCYQIPMNLDYIGTDEYGNIVPTDNPTTGIPTRTQVRFRISKTETGNEGVSKHTAKYLVPMNPVLYEGTNGGKKNPEIPMTQEETGEDMEKMYNFGSNTPQSCFRDLYWNNVYSVKNFIPKTQVAHRAYAPNYSALKGANLVEDQNPVPFNKLRIDLPFMYIVVCIIFRIIILIVTVINTLICGLNVILGFFQKIKNFKLGFLGRPFKRIFGWIPDPIGCIALSAGLEEGNIAYFPGCWCSNGLNEADCPEDMEDDCVKKGGYDAKELKDRIERNLARDFKIVKLDFYQDWINGVLYMPLWYWRKRKKKSFLFGLFVRRAKNEFCDCDKDYTRQKTFVTCEIEYDGNSLQTTDDSVDYDENRWHKRRTSRIWFTNGLIKGVENKDGLTAYYYTAFHANTSDKREHVMPIKQRFNRFYMVRLYATDIILLGNLNEDNYYGIPQLYKGLPSTTANIPLIATVQEDTTNKDDKTPSNDTADATDVGTVITTGMDWGASGASQTPLYSEGLFMDLSCTYADTKAKSCINVERLSELGVGLDMTHNMAYSNGGNDVKYGKISTDGFITKYELDDMETRAMFATLNHIGFIPQDYQDKIGAYATQVQDEHTGYLIPKFKYIYPVDFDGRMSPIMENYSYDFNQASFDETDEAYLTFRLGAESGLTYDKNEERRIRHFYFTKKNDRAYRMPLYNNSFFFYFGINKGSTAIDKFNKLFYAPCFQNDKKPFTFDYSTRGRSYCPSTYAGGNVANYDGYAYIDVVLDDIQMPYSYSLFDEAGMEVISETGMTESRFIIGGYIDDNGNVKSNPEGMVYYQVGSNSGTPVHNMYGNGSDDSSGLTNQTYTLTVTDVNGRHISEKIELSIPKIAVDYEAHQLGTRFYSTATTRIDYICTDETQFYGKLKITDFVVDGYMYYITDSLAQGYDRTSDSYIVWLTGQTDDVSGDEEGNNKLTAYAVIKLGASESPGPGFVKECLCDKTNSATTAQRAAGGVYIEEAALSDPPTTYWFADDKGTKNPNTFFVYQPNNFTLTITQICDNMELSGNTSSEIVAVNNGENFNAYLSGMPVKFMLGSVSDSSAATIANQSNFYRSYIDPRENGWRNGRDPLGAGVIGWFGLHQESTYRFDMPDAATVLRNTDVWLDYVDLKTPITSYKSKANILKFKFNSMFSLSKSGYVVDGTSPFTYTTRGGVNPILYRSVVPQYEAKNFLTKYVLSESNRATGRDDYPMIVGNNYYGHTYGSSDICDQKPYFNGLYTDSEVLGNYFAAFTQNGGYSSSTGIDESIKVAKIPNYTKVTPRNTPREKVIGTDEIKGIAEFRYAFEKFETKYQPYLRSIFVDRRLDFDLLIFAPVIGNSINLYSEAEHGKENIWKSARISGWTYNGIEMSYDSEYNIISANSDASETQYATYANPNKRLEYSYVIPSGGTDGDAITYYNTEQNMVWEEDPPSPTRQIVKRYYTASFGGFDIRNFFWSRFNENRLLSAATACTITSSIPYIFKYPKDNMEYGSIPLPNGYNGDFNMQTVFNNGRGGNYPTVRMIDICNVTPSDSYEFDILPCSYNIKPVVEENGNISCKAVGDDGLSFTNDFSDPISFLSPNDDSNDYGNVLYNGNGTDSSGYKIFTAQTANLYFKYNTVENDLFDIYTSIPRVIKVLPYISGYDGISYIKTVTPTGEIAAAGTIDDVINDYNTVLLHKFEHTGNTEWNFLLNFLASPDTFLPSGLNLDDYAEKPYKNSDGEEIPVPFYYNNEVKDWVTSDCNDFANIKYQKNGIDLSVNGGVMAFCILVDRVYEYIDDDMLKRRLRSIEFGEIYDCRKIRMKIAQDTGGGTPTKTYIECRAGSTVIKDVPTPTGEGSATINQNPETGEVDPTASVSVETEPEDYSGDVKTYIQVITFEMIFNTAATPTESESQAFANYQMMGYTFRFKDSNDDEYDIQPTNITPTEAGDNVILSFTVRWSAGMGVLADRKWNSQEGGKCECTVYAKTQSGFIYKLNYFSISFGGQEGNYKEDTKESDLGDGERGKTTCSIV